MPISDFVVDECILGLIKKIKIFLSNQIKLVIHLP